MAAAPGKNPGLFRFLAGQLQFMAVFEQGIDPFFLAAGDGCRFAQRGRGDDRQAGEAAAQVFAGRLLADAGLGQLRLGLGQSGLALHAVQAGGIAQLLAARYGRVLLAQQGGLLAPLAGRGAFLQPGEPQLQQAAARFVQGVAVGRFGQRHAASAEFGVERAFAGQAQRALNGGVPFVELLIAGTGRAHAALLAAQADVPFIVASFEPAAVGFLDPNLAGGGLHAGIAAQHPGDDFVGRQFRGRRGGQGVTEADQQEQGQGFALQFHRWPDAMTGVIQ